MQQAPFLRYGWLDELPPRLSDPVVAHVHGRLPERGRAILALRCALLAGRIPDSAALEWPEEPMRRALVDALRLANVAPYCLGDAEITDDMLAYLLSVADEAHRFQERAMVAFHMLGQKDRRQLGDGEGSCSGGACNAEGAAAALGLPKVGTAEWEALRAESVDLLCELVRARTSDWSVLTSILTELEAVFSQLGACLNLPPGLARAMLRALPRSDLESMRKMLACLPAVEELVRVLGRMQESKDADGAPVLERIASSVRRSVEVDKQVEARRSAEARGVERSQDVARMLPSEAALLTHPTLKLLWAARFAEHGLLSYNAPGVYTTRVLEQQSFDDGEATEHTRPDRGPILVLLDTSGSMMMGAGEVIAKAVLVQLAGVAYMEKRRLFVYNFGGPSDVVEQELGFEGDGLARMLLLLSSSFHAGTEITEPIRRACARLADSSWRQADLLIASDGYFSVSQEVHTYLRAAKETGSLLVHALAVGGGGGFAELGCDRFHTVSRWLTEIGLS